MIRPTQQDYILSRSPFPTNSKIIFLGRNGSGKTSLVNSLVEKVVFDSGRSKTGGNLTIKTQIYKFTDNIEVIDTPGFGDDEFDRKNSVNEIQFALSRNGNYRIMFVLSLAEGRIKSEDLTTILLLQNAIKINDLSFGIIVTKCSNEFLEDLSDISNYDKYITLLNTGLKFTTNQFFFTSYHIPARGENNYLIPLQQKLVDFIINLESNYIVSTDIEKIDATRFSFYQNQMKIGTELSMLTKNESKLQDAINKRKTQQKNIKVDIETLYGLISKMSNGEKYFISENK
jgi:GTP-binding protein EngB required for normal cell division